jgi:hypothetical protein
MHCDDWPTNATVFSLGNVHADAMASMLYAGSADVAATLLSNIGHTSIGFVIASFCSRWIESHPRFFQSEQAMQ